DKDDARLAPRHHSALALPPPFPARGLVQRQWHDVLARELRPFAIGDVVIEKPGISPRFRRSATVLAGGALQRNDQEFAARRRQRQPFETLVVRPAGFRVRRLWRVRARTRIVGGEVILALALGQKGLGRPDRRLQAAG